MEKEDNSLNFKNWENIARKIKKDCQTIYNENPNLYPLGWKEIALFRISEKLKDHNIFKEKFLDSIRLSMAEQLLNL